MLAFMKRTLLALMYLFSLCPAGYLRALCFSVFAVFTCPSVSPLLTTSVLSVNSLCFCCVCSVCLVQKRGGGQGQRAPNDRRRHRRRKKLHLVHLRAFPMLWFAALPAVCTLFHRAALRHAVQQPCRHRAAPDAWKRCRQRHGEGAFTVIMHERMGFCTKLTTFLSITPFSFKNVITQIVPAWRQCESRRVCVGTVFSQAAASELSFSSIHSFTVTLLEGRQDQRHPELWLHTTLTFCLPPLIDVIESKTSVVVS